MRNRRVLSNLAEGAEKARFPSIVSSQSASITLITLNSKRKRSALSVPSHFHDRIHDARWQAMPAYDKLTDGRILPTQFRQAQGSLSQVTGGNDLRRSGRGCNSRRLHSYCHKSLIVREL